MGRQGHLLLRQVTPPALQEQPDRRQSPEEGQGPAEESGGRALDEGWGGRKGQPPPVRTTSPLP